MDRVQQTGRSLRFDRRGRSELLRAAHWVTPRRRLRKQPGTESGTETYPPTCRGRVKWRGKSPPAAVRATGRPNPARSKAKKEGAKGARPQPSGWPLWALSKPGPRLMIGLPDSSGRQESADQ